MSSTKQCEYLVNLLSLLTSRSRFHRIFVVINHRWPKRNITGSPVRNMRVCMGEIEFETDEINEVKAIKVINKV